MPRLRKSGPPNAADWGRRYGGGGARFGEDLARSVHKNIPERNDANQAKWLAERRLEQEHVYAMAEEYDIAKRQNETYREEYDKANRQNETYRGVLEHSERYISKLEAELSNLRATYGNASSVGYPSIGDGGGDRPDHSIRDVQNTASGGKAPTARSSDEVPRDPVLDDNRTGVADGGGEQHGEPNGESTAADDRQSRKDQ